ncbi:hypothetical protein [Psychrobacillus psychrodurans]
MWYEQKNVLSWKYQTVHVYGTVLI